MTGVPLDIVISRIELGSDGTLYWRDRPGSNFALAGKPCLLRLNKGGYHRVRIAQKQVSAHRIVWALHHGSWPSGEIDHINRIRTDNRIENLRDVSRIQNASNRVGCRNATLSLYGSVMEHRSGWRVRFRLGGETVEHTFETRAEADAARLCGSKIIMALKGDR